jgi:two-component system NtrC family sensor kinase
VAGETQAARSYAKLHRRLLRAMLAVCLVPLFLVGAAAYLQFQHYARKMVLDQQERLVQNHRDFIESFLESRSAELDAVAHQYTLEQLRSGELERVFGVLQQGSGIYTDIGIIDDQGAHLKYLGPYNLSGRNYRGTDWFQALRARGLVMSDVFMGYRAVPHFIIAVKRQQGERYWILRASLSTDYFSQIVERVRVGRTGEAFILDRTGLFQTKTQFGGGLLQPSGYPRLQPHAGICSFERVEGGRTILYSDVWMAENRWLLVFRQDKGEAFAPLQRALWTTILITLAGVAGVTVASLAIARNLVRYVRRADEEKEALNRQLEASSKMAAIGEMAAGVAHEINNPLGIIETLKTWILDLVTEQGVAKEDLSEVIESTRKIGDQVERCRRITHDLLKFSRRTESERAEVDLNALLSEMVEMVQHRARAENITFTLDFGRIPKIEGSPSRLQQVFLNLLNNAVDAMERGGGTVTVRTRPVPQGVRAEVSDTGCGIPEENLSRIFEPFFTTKPVGRGTGLGLAVCYGLVVQMGGRLEVRSQVGAGTTFTLTLPLGPPGPRPLG